MRLRLDDAGATLHVRAENMTVAMHLDAGFRDLGERLEQFGIRLAGLQVSCDGSAGWAMG
ncbi:MAG: flagellar hook-length control protein FliK [candidate division WS1 bacterium]|nr:flagellar hook-length control protein FliK [candidate division WS1 bacterium]